MARLLVGLSSLSGDLARYVAKFDMVELHPGSGPPTPKAPKLRSWRKTAPPAFMFSAVMPPAVGLLAPGPALEVALGAALEVARTVEARCIVVQTPPSVRPTAANEKRLIELFARVPREGVVRVWEPQGGLWEGETLARVARATGVVVAVDAAREDVPAGPIAYTRLRALGKGAVFGAATIDRVASRLRGRREAFVVVDSPRDGARVRSGLLAALGRVGGGATVVRTAMPGPMAAEDEEQ